MRTTGRTNRLTGDGCCACVLLVAILASGISYIDDFIFAWRRTRLYGSYELHVLLGDCPNIGPFMNSDAPTAASRREFGRGSATELARSKRRMRLTATSWLTRCGGLNLRLAHTEALSFVDETQNLRRSLLLAYCVFVV